jgi:hypothetical protein
LSVLHVEKLTKMREVISIAFRDINLLGVDNRNIKMIPGVDNMVMVPFTLSEAPSEEWRHVFSSKAPRDAEARIEGDRALYKCPKDKAVIKGECRNRVAKLVDDTNLHCREYDAEREQKRAEERQEQLLKHRKQKEFDEWKRDW